MFGNGKYNSKLNLLSSLFIKNGNAFHAASIVENVKPPPVILTYISSLLAGSDKWFDAISNRMASGGRQRMVKMVRILDLDFKYRQFNAANLGLGRR